MTQGRQRLGWQQSADGFTSRLSWADSRWWRVLPTAIPPTHLPALLGEHHQHGAADPRDNDQGSGEGDKLEKERKIKVFLFHLQIWENQFSVSSSQCTLVGCVVSCLSCSVVSVALGGLAASFFFCHSV